MSDTYTNLDYAASTPMRPEAIRAQLDYDASEIAGANPNRLRGLDAHEARGNPRSA